MLMRNLELDGGRWRYCATSLKESLNAAPEPQALMHGSSGAFEAKLVFFQPCSLDLQRFQASTGKILSVIASIYPLARPSRSVEARSAPLANAILHTNREIAREDQTEPPSLCFERC